MLSLIDVAVFECLWRTQLSELI